jgi:P-type Mg2+ transporter
VLESISCCGFSDGWFVESLITQTLIIHVIRANKIPFIESRASWLLTVTTLSIMALGAWLPHFADRVFPGLGAFTFPVLAYFDGNVAQLYGSNADN